MDNKKKQNKPTPMADILKQKEYHIVRLGKKLWDLVQREADSNTLSQTRVQIMTHLTQVLNYLERDYIAHKREVDEADVASEQESEKDNKQ